MALKEQYLNLHIPDLHNIKLLGVADISLYANENPLVNPTLEITPPGFSKVFVPFSKGGFVVLNSNNLDLSCVEDECNLLDLPDGIWKIKYTFAPVTDNVLEKTFIRTTEIERKFGLAVLATDIKQCSADVKDADMDILDQAWYFIQGAIADANECNPKAAMNKYRVAETMLDKFSKCK